MIYQPEIKPANNQVDIEVKHIATCRLPTEWGEFQMHGFEEVATGQDHVALTMGDIDDGEPVLTRVHSECLTGDALFSQRCDCGPQLQAAMQAIQAKGRGCIVYLRQEQNPCLPIARPRHGHSRSQCGFGFARGCTQFCVGAQYSALFACHRYRVNDQ